MANELTAQKTNETSAIIATIERAASSNEVDLDKMQALLNMQERILDRNAKQAFYAAMSQMQSDMPEVVERAKAHNTNYASFEDINAAVRPVLQRHGFAVTFRVHQDTQGIVKVTAVLSHTDGHSEDTSLLLPYDTTGSKNAVQAVGSSVSYGKRYTMCALLNIATRGEDDDANGAVAVRYITPFQVRTIRTKLAYASDETKAWLKSEYGSAERIPADEYDNVMASLSNGAA
jgi:hypothetical protein